MAISQTHAFAALAEALLTRRDDIVDRGLAAAAREVPVYAGLDSATLDDVRSNLVYDLELLGRLLSGGGPGASREVRLSLVSEADRDPRRAVANRRARQGVPLADFLHVYRVSQRV